MFHKTVIVIPWGGPVSHLIRSGGLFGVRPEQPVRALTARPQAGGSYPSSQGSGIVRPLSILGIVPFDSPRRRGVVCGGLSFDIVNGMLALIVAAAIFAHSPRGLRVLVVQHSYPQELAGLWEFPSGKVEPGEDPEGALRRELRGELGIEVSIAAGVGVVVGPDGDWTLPGECRVRLWAAYAKGEPRLGQSHMALRWLGESDLESVPWFEGDLQILSSLARLMHSLGRP